MARSRTTGSAGGLLRTLERTGMRKGFGGNRSWLYVGTGLWTLRTVRRLAGPRTEVLISEELAPGQRMIIANGRATIDDGGPTEPVRGRKARKARKAERKAARRSAA